jgi:hypothetical protein
MIHTDGKPTIAWADLEDVPKSGRPEYLVSVDLGGLSVKVESASLADAKNIVDELPDPEGYSSWEARIYQWATRAVDGAPYLKLVERYWFGELVNNADGPRLGLQC